MAFSTPISGGEPAPGAFEVFSLWAPPFSDTVMRRHCIVLLLSVLKH